MAHHHEGPSQYCYRCKTSYRDDHECLGDPAETVEKFVRWYGAQKVREWLTLAETKMTVEQQEAQRVERERGIKRLQETVEAGKKAEAELQKQLKER